MKRQTKYLLTAAWFGIGLGGSAVAADLAPVYKAPVVAAPYSWTGWYGGVNAGYGVGSGAGSYDYAFRPAQIPYNPNNPNNPNNGGGSGEGAITTAGAAVTTAGAAVINGNSAIDPTQTFNAMPGGGFGGGQFGYNYQMGTWVLGLETDIQGAGISDNRTCLLTCFGGASAMIDQKLNWFGTTRARVGLANGPVFSYVTAGAAYGGTETGVTTTVPGPSGFTSSMTNSATKTGWTWGTGIEAALGGNWTAKVEYLYVNLGSAAASNSSASGFTATFNTKYQEQLVRGGINYRFGPDQTAAIGPYNWAGLFVGGTFGFDIGRNDSAFVVPGASADAFDLSPRGYNGGGLVGYNWQFGKWVAGVEADIQDATGSGYLTCVEFCNGILSTAIDQKLSWFGTLRGRLGYAVGPALFYVTGGGSYGQVKEEITQTAGGLGFSASQSFSHDVSGYAVGGGIENRLDFFGLLGPNWTTRTEYLYMNLGSITDNFTAVNGVTQTLNSNIHQQVFRTAVTYKFGS